MYLASQDNPENTLCPYLRSSEDPPTAFQSLLFSAPRPSCHPDSGRQGIQGLHNRRRKSKSESDAASRSSAAKQCSSAGEEQCLKGSAPATVSVEQHDSPPCPLSVSEHPVNRDYRSFSASTFGMVAFKMLEWLTPQSVAAVYQRASALAYVQQPGLAEHTSTDRSLPDFETQEGRLGSQIYSSEQALSLSSAEGRESPLRQSPAASRPSNDPSRPGRNSKSGTLVPSVMRDRSFPPPGPEDVKVSTKAPNNGAFRSDGKGGRKKGKGTVVTRCVPGIPAKPTFFDNVTLPRPPQSVESDGVERSPYYGEDTKSHLSDAGVSPCDEEEQDTEPMQLLPETTSLAQCPLPQSLRRLDLGLVEFICQTFEEDKTSELLMARPLDVDNFFPEPLCHTASLKRKSSPRPRSYKRQWKAFNEQTIFSVLSDPSSLVQSFVENGRLYDSPTLWYCMARLTQNVPSLALHSLWMAAESLFVPPKSLQAVRSLNRKVFRLTCGKSLSNFEAGAIMSICMHALVAMVPLVPDVKTLFEVSRIRAKGQALSGNGATTEQPAATCLAYDDVFSNDLALRLAKRLFSAIIARQAFAEIADSDRTVSDTARDLDVLRPILGQLDVLGNHAGHILEFSHAEQLLHETRVPTLLLDWARAVLMSEWDGQPFFQNDGPFSGALSLMATICTHLKFLVGVESKSLTLYR